MAENPPISFLIPAYNCENTLLDAVESITNGNIGPHDEIIIVDDASTDTTRGVIGRIASRNTAVRTYSHRHNRGSAAAGRNSAIELAKHDILFALDADNLLVEGSISKLAQFLVNERADAAAFREVRFFNGDAGRPTHSWFYPEKISLADALAGHYWPGPQGNYMFTRTSWIKAGRYDESVGGGIDSWAFGIRQLATGSRMKTLAETHYLHRWGHESAWTRDAKSGGYSLKALRVLLPFLDCLEPESIEYVLSFESRTSWFEKLEERPLKVRHSAPGTSGTSHRHPQRRRNLLEHIRRLASRTLVKHRRGPDHEATRLLV